MSAPEALGKATVYIFHQLTQDQRDAPREGGHALGGTAGTVANDGSPSAPGDQSKKVFEPSMEMQGPEKETSKDGAGSSYIPRRISPAEMMWKHTLVRDHILDMLHQPEKGKFADKALAPLLTVDKTTHAAITTRLYRIVILDGPNMGEKGLFGYLDRAGAVQQHVEQYSKLMQSLRVAAPFLTMTDLDENHYFETFPNLKEVHAQLCLPPGYAGPDIQITIQRDGHARLTLGLQTLATANPGVPGRKADLGFLTETILKRTVPKPKLSLTEFRIFKDSVMPGKAAMNCFDPMALSPFTRICDLTNLTGIGLDRVVLTLEEISWVTTAYPALTKLQFRSGQALEESHLELLAERCPRIIELIIAAKSDWTLRAEQTADVLTRRLPDLVVLRIPLSLNVAPSRSSYGNPYAVTHPPPKYPGLGVLEFYIIGLVTAEPELLAYDVGGSMCSDWVSPQCRVTFSTDLLPPAVTLHATTQYRFAAEAKRARQETSRFQLHLRDSLGALRSGGWKHLGPVDGTPMSGSLQPVVDEDEAPLGRMFMRWR